MLFPLVTSQEITELVSPAFHAKSAATSLFDTFTRIAKETLVCLPETKITPLFFYTESICKINRWLAVICFIERLFFVRGRNPVLAVWSCVNHLHIYIPSNIFYSLCIKTLFNSLLTSLFISITRKKTLSRKQQLLFNHCVEAHGLDWVTGRLLSEALNVQ